MINKRDRVAIPRIWVTFALSVLIHALVLWRVLPQVRTPSSDEKALKDGRSQLSVQLVPRRVPPPTPQMPPAVRKAPAPKRPAEAPPRPAPREAPPKVAPKPVPKPPPAPPPPVLGIDKPAPAIQPPPERVAPQRPAPAPRAPADTDLASYIEARRRARGESAPPPPAPDAAPSVAMQEDPNARANRLAAANLGVDRKATFAPDQRRGGGVFSIQRVAFDYAEFFFYGWNKDIKRETQQLIEVRKGSNSDIRIAVVRRMIAIIRDHEQGDFTWDSPRLGRKITLSARARDTSGLEGFLMQEFFGDDRR